MTVFHIGAIAFVTFFVAHSFADCTSSDGKKSDCARHIQPAEAGVEIGAMAGGIMAGRDYLLRDVLEARDKLVESPFVNSKGVANSYALRDTTRKLRADDVVTIEYEVGIGDEARSQREAMRVQRQEAFERYGKNTVLANAYKGTKAEDEYARIAREASDEYTRLTDSINKIDKGDFSEVAMRSKPKAETLTIPEGKTAEQVANDFIDQRINHGGRITKISRLASENRLKWLSTVRKFRGGAVGLAVGLGVWGEEKTLALIEKGIEKSAEIYLPSRSAKTAGGSR